MIGPATAALGLVPLDGGISFSRFGSAWDPAPTVLVGAAIALLLFTHAFVRLRRRGRAGDASWSRPVLFLLAVALGTLPLVSPLDAIGDSYLLSAHMLQHVLIGDAAPALAVAALRGPLLFFLLPRPMLRGLARLRSLRRLLAFLCRPLVSLTAWLLVIAAWHIPAAYDYTLRHQTAHDLEHLSFITVGLLVWMQLVDPARSRQLTVHQRLAYMLALFTAGTLLGAVLVAAPTPLYPAYAAQEQRLFQLTPPRDQRLAGLVMIAEQLVSLGVCAAFLTRSRLRPLRVNAGATPPVPGVRSGQPVSSSGGMRRR